ncbi:MAG TPA: hypothetical protein PJ997_01405 [Candidatus Paceibacterota bacterium]|nr:hypothetical protein [Candidatus Paceibacterota bacterium]HMP18975.1 hypothetical protein [Candidatus Paceibacterota bacterium]HMP85405.1 hypothetical protein [Candidatus Paceibacterota bacterium]
MIYTFYGDSKKVFEKSSKLVDDLLSKKPNSEVFKINNLNLENFSLDELIGGQSLFSKKYIVIFSGIISNEENSDKILEKISNIKKSENIFIFCENFLKKEKLKILQTESHKFLEFKKTESNKDTKSKSFQKLNAFSLADYFGQRDVRKMWLCYLKLIKNSQPEELHGILWWQLKIMILASKTNSAQHADLKPFVYSKAKKYSNNFTFSELQNISDKMVEIYHESHRGGANLSIRLEKFILGL